MPATVKDLARQLAARLAQVPGVVAVALGGSHARGAARPDSDVDLALYYHEAAPFAIDQVRALARSVNDRPDPVVADFYGWGDYVNGGAWLTVAGQRVDFLYRNVDQVQRVIDDCRAGRWEYRYFMQPVYGGHSHSYLGETHVCVPLHDPDGVLAALKALVADYPPALKEGLLDTWLGAVEILDLYAARKAASREDVYNAVGALTRIASRLTQALFALNETYFLNDKGALEAIDGFARRPARYRETVTDILAHPGATSSELTESVERMATLYRQVKALSQP
jgi:hypothetical protein